MLQLAFKKQLEKKLLIQNIIVFVLMMVIYSMLDYLGYRDATQNGLTNPTGIIVANVIINIFLSALTTLTIGLSTANVQIMGREVRGSGFFPTLAIILGFITFGCTSCVITFFASIGITFLASASALAGNGIWFKLGALGLLIIGLVFVSIMISKATCKINLKEEAEEK
jgi:hypothetical protein